MTLFQRYFAVDWSANNGPKLGKDSVWIAEQGAGEHEVHSVNLPTRHAAMAHLRERFLAAVEAGERVLAGFDFPFGFPAGAAQRLAGQGGWAALWKMLAQEISDDEANRSNRFAVASHLNERLGVGGARFWGAPKSAATPHLDLDKKRADFAQVGEFRQAERLARGAKSAWQLFYNGSVGSQALLGMAQLERLRTDPQLMGQVSIWPFDTEFDQRLDSSIVLAEIYPSWGLTLDPSIGVRDRAQVEAQVHRFAALDRAGELGRFMGFPSHLDESVKASALRDEGWIFGAGHGEQGR